MKIHRWQGSQLNMWVAGQVIRGYGQGLRVGTNRDRGKKPNHKNLRLGTFHDWEHAQKLGAYDQR